MEDYYTGTQDYTYRSVSGCQGMDPKGRVSLGKQKVRLGITETRNWLLLFNYGHYWVMLENLLLGRRVPLGRIYRHGAKHSLSYTGGNPEGLCFSQWGGTEVNCGESDPL